MVPLGSAEPVAATDAENRRHVVRQTEDYVRDLLGRESTGHDWWHADRVRRTATGIASAEGADVFVVELAAILHDVDDYKFSGDDEAGPQAALRWLVTVGLDTDRACHVADIIRNISFKGSAAEPPLLSLEGKCIQDADRLDAIGAIGIARTFAYGGYVRRPIHDPGVPPVANMTETDYRKNIGTTVNHFYEKLLLLKDLLHTASAQKLAESRHRFMEDFLKEFEREWRSGDLLSAIDQGESSEGRAGAGSGLYPHPALGQ